MVMQNITGLGGFLQIMKKRLQCLLLALIMLSACFLSACSEESISEDAVQKEAPRPAMTVTLWGIKGENTTDAAIEQVEQKMSEITQSKYNTAVELHLFTVEEYAENIEGILEQVSIKQEEDEALSAFQAAVNELYKISSSDKDEVVYVEDETYIDDIGISHVIYPEPEELQVDIMYIPEYYKYIEYIENGYLCALDTELEAAGREMKTYIHPNILNASTYDNATYAIINNKPVGEITYLLLNNDMLDKYYYDASEITLFNSDACDQFITDVGEGETGIVPVLGDFDPVGVQYFTADGEKSVVGNMLPGTAKKGSDAYGVPRIIFTTSTYVDHLRQIKKYQSLGYMGDGTADIGEFAVGVVRCSASDVKQYENNGYTAHILQQPHVDNSIYQDMFGISTGTANITRSMEILCELNTNSELRNLFGYGIMGEHYNLDADGVVVKANTNPENVYDTPLNYTGNMFIAYPPEGSYANIWEDAKAQNLNIVDDPYFGFFYEDLIDAADMQAVAKISKTYFDELDNTSYAGFDAWLEDATAKLAIDPIISDYVTFEEKPNSLAAIYNEWFYTLYPNAMA